MISLNTPSDALDSLAHFIKVTRLRANVPMRDLAERSGIGIATLARVEKNGICSTDTLARILAALGTIDSFIESLTPPEPTSIAELRQVARKNERQRARRV